MIIRKEDPDLFYTWFVVPVIIINAPNLVRINITRTEYVSADVIGTPVSITLASSLANHLRFRILCTPVRLK